MHHPLIVHVYQSPSDIHELLGKSSVKGVVGGKSEAEGLRVRTDRRLCETG